MIDAAQLGKIAARIESTHDGEALNAARMLVKRLGGHGLRIAEVIERGVSGGNAGNFDWSKLFTAKPSPPSIQHKIMIDEMLADMAFVGEHLTRRTHDRLMTLWYARDLDDANAAYVENWHAKYRAGRAA